MGRCWVILLMSGLLPVVCKYDSFLLACLQPWPYGCGIPVRHDIAPMLDMTRTAQVVLGSDRKKEIELQRTSHVNSHSYVISYFIFLFCFLPNLFFFYLLKLLLADSAARLMYSRVYGSRVGSHQSAPSPSLCYSLTHAHRSIGYRNRNPQLLADSAARLMYLRVYGSRVSSHQLAPSPSLCYFLTHSHNTLPTPSSSRSHALRCFGFLSV